MSLLCIWSWFCWVMVFTCWENWWWSTEVVPGKHSLCCVTLEHNNRTESVFNGLTSSLLCDPVYNVHEQDLKAQSRWGECSVWEPQDCRTVCSWVQICQDGSLNLQVWERGSLNTAPSGWGGGAAVRLRQSRSWQVDCCSVSLTAKLSNNQLIYVRTLSCGHELWNVTLQAVWT